MKLVSINVSTPVEVLYEGKLIRTGIFKSPVNGAVAVTKINLEGDGQADLTVHGGVDKAVYAYSLDHYAYWQRELGMRSMPHGQFGENLTIAGLDEAASHIGDHLSVGTSLFAITQPRVPCFKLGIRVGNPEMPKLFTKSQRTGFYLKVLSEGVITPGDAIETVHYGVGRVSVKEIFQAYFSNTPEAREVLARSLEVPELAEVWRKKIAQRLAGGR